MHTQPSAGTWWRLSSRYCYLWMVQVSVSEMEVASIVWQSSRGHHNLARDSGQPQSYDICSIWNTQQPQSIYLAALVACCHTYLVCRLLGFSNCHLVAETEGGRTQIMTGHNLHGIITHHCCYGYYHVFVSPSVHKHHPLNVASLHILYSSHCSCL